MSSVYSSDADESKEDWLDIGNAPSLPSVDLDDVLHDLDQSDDGLSFLDSDDCSFIGGSAPSQATPTLFTYQRDSGLTGHIIDSISHQLVSLSAKAGSPLCIAEKAGRIAVGTSKGMLLLFDKQGRLERFSSSDESIGPAAAVSFSPDGKTVAVGFGRGAIKVLSTSSGSTIHLIHEAVQPGRGVLQIVYLERSHSFLALDNGGNVFEVRLRSNFARKKSQQIRCVFSGCNGEVVNMQSLPHSLLALITVSKVLIVSTRFGGSVLCAFPLKTNMYYPPLFDCFDQGKREELYLCLCRGPSLSLFSLHTSRISSPHSNAPPSSLSSSRPRVTSLIKSIQLDQPAVSVHWIGQNDLVVVDSHGKTYLVDIARGTCTLSAAVNHLQIVFGTAAFKGLATGGNVSSALSCVAEAACYSSILSNGQGNLLALCHDGLYLIERLTELQQLEKYEQRNDYVSACLFLLDLKRGKVRGTDEFAPFVDKLLREYIVHLSVFTAQGYTSGKVSELIAHYKKHISILIHVIFNADMEHLLYDEVWPRLERDALSRSSLLDLLDDVIADGCLQQAPPTLLSAYLSNLATEGHFSQLQTAVLRLPIHSIDLHMVMSTCRQNGLYDGIIYVMNKALLDYISPLEEMLTTVGEFASREVFSDAEVEQGNRLLLYIHCCLAGHSYPYGTLEKELAERVPLEVYRCITSLHGKDGSSSQLRYPYLRLLLQFDAQQFVHVICTCVDAPIFREGGRLQRLAEMIGVLSSELRTRQPLVHFLLMTSQLADNENLLIPGEMVEEAICCLLRLSWQDPAPQWAIVDSLRLFSAIPRKTILRLAQTPMRSHVCTFIFMEERRFVDLIQCYMTTENKKESVSIIRRILHSDLSPSEENDVCTYVRSHLPALCLEDASSCAHLVLDFFPDILPSLSTAQPEERRRARPLLTAAFHIRRENNEKCVAGDEDLDEQLFGIVFEGLAEGLGGTKQKDENMQDLLSYWLPLGSRTDFCLNVAAEAECVGATVVLLEARGLLQRAFESLFSMLRPQSPSPDAGSSVALYWLDRLLVFCGRHSNEAKQNGWLLAILSRLTENGDIADIDCRLDSLCSRILSTGTQHAHQLFSSLLEYPPFRQGDHATYGHLIRSILSSCSFERTMLEEILKSTDVESSSTLRDMANLGCERISGPVLPQCTICGLPLNKAAFVFRCGHVVHMDCDNGKRICACEASKKGIVSRRLATSSFRPMMPIEPPKTRQYKDIFENWNEPLRLAPNA